MPKTPVSGFRLPVELRQQIWRIAGERNTTPTRIVIEALTQYVQGRTK